MHEIDHVIHGRRSVRGFIPDKEVPIETLHEVLELAQQAPSNCNVQPWRVFIASGAARDRLRSALIAAVTQGELPTAGNMMDSFPGEYRRLQVACAVAMYSAMGIAREDQEGRLRAMLRNFEFFDAPHVAIVCMEEHFGVRVALDVGAYLQTLLLALWSRGIASCAQASLTTYPEIVRRELGIPEKLRVLCGISFGYEDPSVPANATRQSREPLKSHVTFLRD